MAKRMIGAAVLVLAICVAPLAAADDPHMGTWKFNAEKSKGSPLKSGMVTIEPDGDGVAVTVDLVDVNGNPVKWGVKAKYDGKDYPVTGSTPLGDSLAITRVDAHTSRVTFKQGGKVTVNQSSVVSADGKTRTVTTKGTTADGQAIDSMTVYEKQ